MTAVCRGTESPSDLRGWPGNYIAQPGLFWGVENRAATSYARGGVAIMVPPLNTSTGTPRRAHRRSPWSG